MLTIRLSRVGKKNKPMYRLIISEKTRDPYGRVLEFLGSYNPRTKELKAKDDKIKYWINQGSGLSATVNNLLISKGIIKGKKVKASKSKKKKKQKKTDEKEPNKEEMAVKTDEKEPSLDENGQKAISESETEKKKNKTEK